MLSLDDPKWKALRGGRRIPFDASPALRRLGMGVDEEKSWHELWDGLHHQGDVDEASYAAVPHLIALRKAGRALGWNYYALVTTIEIERHRVSNPAIPSWLENDYRDAWRDVLNHASEDISLASDTITVRSILGAMATAKGNLKLACLIIEMDESELEALG